MRFKGTKLSNRTVALFAAAILLLSSGGFMGVKAAPQIQGQNYEAELQLNSIDVQLLENGDPVKEGKMLSGLNGKAKPGWTYAETIGAENIGSSPAYVRIVIRKYWTDKKGQKATDLSPDLIKLDTSNEWAINEDESTDEMSVYYYQSPLDPNTSAQLVNSVRIDDSVLDDMTITSEKKDNATIYTYEYKYDGYSFNIEAEAQAVQTHNADEAIKSIWGVEKGDVLK
ncbi:MAG: hypothetical protein IJI39_07670 [Clostridia bacterium]|nr:hypothetical protein [Clostridia bacterium]